MAPVTARLALAAVLLAVSPARFCSGCNLGNLTLEKADFSGATYIATNFGGADLRDASFRKATLVAGNFAGADLRGAAFDGSSCTACNFVHAKLDGTTFAGSRMVAANFSGFAASVTDAVLRDLLDGCVSCNFKGADLSGRNLAHSTLISIDFSKADVRGTNFDGAALCWYVVNQKQRTVACDSFEDANVSGANFSDVVVCDDPADRQGCSLVGGDTLRRSVKSPLDGAVTSSPD